MSNNLFICEVCGGVTPDDCLKCPDRGNGKGVTVQKIKNDLKACPTHGDITDCRRHYGRHIATLRAKGGEARTMAIQIDNLVGYMRRELKEKNIGE